VVAVACILAAGAVGGQGPAWGLGTALLAGVLLAEHLYVAPRGELRPERIGKAFFDFNAFASVAFALCAIAGLLLRSHG
jgi:4-hydroxybenzoate polyprenyltransferase